MADQSIFDANQNNPQVTPENKPTPTPSPASDNVADLLSQIKNEKGEQKYKTLEDALVGLQHSQSFIQTLRKEKQQVEEEVSSLRPVAEKVTELERVVLQLTQPNNAPAPTPAPAISEESIAQLVEQTLSKKQQAEVAKANIQAVSVAVQKEFGEQAEQVFYSKAEELGLSRAEVNQLAARTPQAVLKMLGITEVKQVPNAVPTRTSINTASLEPAKNTFIGRNSTRLEVGATAHELAQESVAARKMVEELNEKGMSIDDLTKPSNYYKFFR